MNGSPRRLGAVRQYGRSAVSHVTQGSRVQKFLTVYLLVTGIGAAAALAMPGLVVLGFFLLILPGLVLNLAPTAFLWGCVFTASWLAARIVLGDTLLTVLAASAITALA